MNDLVAAISALSSDKQEALRRLLTQQGSAFNTFPLSFAQQRLWFLQQLDPESVHTTIAVAVRLVGSLDRRALEWSLNEIARRHETLRTSFVAIGGQPAQLISPALPFAVTAVDLRAHPGREAEVRRRITAEVRRPFDLEQGPLARYRLFQLGAEEHTLLITMHHIIADGWSLGVLVHELTALYSAAITGQPMALSELPIQYADFASWQHERLSGALLESQLAYWHERLGGELPLLNLPTDRPRPPIQTYRGATRALTLPWSLADALVTLNRRENATLFMTLLATFKTLLYRFTDQEDIIVGSPVAGREQAETELLIGCFVNTLALRTSLAGDPPFRELLNRVRAVTLGALAHQDLPFEKLVEQVQPQRDLSRQPLFQTMFALQNAPLGNLALPGLEVSRVEVDRGATQFDLTLSIEEITPGLVATIEYNTDLFDAETIGRMFSHFQVLLEGIAADPQRRLCDLPLLTEGEQRQLLVDWNGTGAAYPHERCVHQLFEQQATRTPDALALVFDSPGVRGQGSGVRRQESGDKETRRQGDKETEDRGWRIDDPPSSILNPQSLTYRELNRRANQLAHYLRGAGIGPDMCVGICMGRSLEVVVALLGVLKAGGAYVPLDPAFPQERLAFMLADSRAPILLTTSDQRPATGDRRPEAHMSDPSLIARDSVLVVCLDADWPLIAQMPDTDLGGSPDPAQLAYVIYTSGSTGTPKGVQIPHGALSNFLHAMRQALGLTEQDRLLSVTTLSFDIAALELYLPLIVGAALVLVPHEATIDGEQLLVHLHSAGATVMQATPSTWRLLLAAGWQGRPRIMALCGGEMLPDNLARQLVARGAALWNLYGPTETTIWSTMCVIGADEERITIGRPIANTQVYMLDRQLHPLPIGIPGELYIGGAGLARGYRGRPNLTAERFIPNPFGTMNDEGRTMKGTEDDSSFIVHRSSFGERLYKTGDLARYRPDGQIEYLGRMDYQVKLRGFRIELGEIEAALRQHPTVCEAVVLAREVQPGEQQLVAYIVTSDKSQVTSSEDLSLVTRHSPLVTELRAFLQGRLPGYMIPAAFVVLEALPLTPNGKVDRKALPAPKRTADAGEHAFAAPRTPAEELIAGIWAEVLGLDRVGADDDFFALGGHSLLAMQIVARVRDEFRVPLPLRTLFETRTVAGLAARLNARDAMGEQEQPPPPLRPITRDGDLPLSFAQERLWFLDQWQPGTSVYTIPIALRLRGALDVGALERSLNAIARRHETLRTTFVALAGRPTLRIAPVDGALSNQVLPLLDLRGLPERERAAAGERLNDAEARGAFDLARGPLWRAALLRLDIEEHILLFTIHHIVADGWSLGVLMRELGSLYAAFTTGRPASLPELPIQYVDIAHWQRQCLHAAALEHHLAYWRQQLGGELLALDLPIDYPRPAIQTFHGATRSLRLPPSLNADLQALSRREGATLFMTLLAAFAILLGRSAGQEDIVVGTPIAGRTRAEAEQLIGIFLNTLVLRTSLGGDPTFHELLGRVREVTLDAYAHQDLPFEKLLEELQPKRDLSRSPLFQVFFNMLNFPYGRIELPGLTDTLLSPPEIGSKFDLTLYIAEQEAAIELNLVYNADLFKPVRIGELLDQFAHLLSQIVADPQAQISTFSLVTTAAAAILPRPDAPLDATWHGAVQTHFSEQAQRLPDQLAIVDPYERWSYAQLDARTNQLAHYLLEHNVGARSIVAIYGHRSAAIVWAVLGVLKAGAAFVILDPAYPAARLVEYLTLARPRGLIQVAAAGPLPEAIEAWLGAAGPICRLSLPRRIIADTSGLLREYPATIPQVVVGPDDLACISFTSGSTGQPKGVLGRHGPLSHFLPWQNQRFELNESDHFSMLSGLAHDPLQRDMFTALWVGGTICIPAPEQIGVPGWLADWAQHEAISIAHLTPAMGQLLAEGARAGQTIPSLRYAFFVGDILTRHDLSRLRRLASLVTCVNLYGSTETQRAVGYFVVPNDERPGHDAEPARAKEVVPLGYGMPDVQLLVLTPRQHLAGCGEVGEIYVRSPHLAAGYLGSPALTAERFLADDHRPFDSAQGRPPTTNPSTPLRAGHRPPATDVSLNPDHAALGTDHSTFGTRYSALGTQHSALIAHSSSLGTRLYRTGDLGRYRLDGAVEFIARADRQVKIRGFRIELGEIEATLATHPSVREAVVLVREDTPGDKRLVAYVVSKIEDRGLKIEDSASDAPDPLSSILYPLSSELRRFLQSRLPEYMLPAAFVILQALPLTPNGKLDRKALPAPAWRLPAAEDGAPRTSIEARVAAIWTEVLGVEQVGVHDDFFALGGHSLLATRVIARMREAFATELSLQSLFEEPTIARLAQILAQQQGQSDETPISVFRDERDIAQRHLDSLDELSDDEVDALLNDMLVDYPAGATDRDPGMRGVRE